MNEKKLNEGNQRHNSIYDIGSGTVIITVPVPVPTFYQVTVPVPLVKKNYGYFGSGFDSTTLD